MKRKCSKMAILFGLIVMLTGCASLDQATVADAPVGGAPGLKIDSPAAQAGDAARDDYFVFQSVTLGDTNKKLTGFSTSGLLAVLKTSNGNTVDYELWTRDIHSSGSNQGKEESDRGPVRFSRNPTSEEVSFSTKGFGLVEDVINQIMAQVQKSSRVEGAWTQKISLNLLKTHLPGKLTFHFNVQKIELKPGVPALLIRTYSDVFKIDVLPTAASANNGYFAGMYKGALVYSPEDHRLYQMASQFDVRRGVETLQMQDTAFLAGLDGKPVFPLLDMRDVLDMPKEKKPNPLVSMPPWAMQVVKVQQTINLASATTAERASNPAVLPIIAQILEIDGFAGMMGLPSSSSLIESYGQIHGGEAGELAARFFSTVGSEAIGASGLLPSTLLAANVPVIAALATAYSVYTMYTIAADMAGLAIAADVGKLTPFSWPKCKPMDCIAQADKAFDLEEGVGQTPEPGPVPEPPSGTNWKKVGWVAGGAAAIATGVALGVSAAEDTEEDEDESSTINCDSYVSSCCTTSGGIQVVLVPVPKTCGGCPGNTTDVGDDNVTAGGPYDLCDCNCP